MLQTIIQNAVDAISLGSLFALTALGIGLIFGVMRLINFAHGDFIMVGAYALIVPSAVRVASPDRSILEIRDDGSSTSVRRPSTSVR